MAKSHPFWKGAGRGPAKAKRYRRGIMRSELARMAFCNAKGMPNLVNDGGRRKRWVGIGWVDEGPARGTECRVLEDK